MTINVQKNSSVAATSILASHLVLNINYHQCPLIVTLILALRFVLNINYHQCPLTLILLFIGKEKINVLN